MSASGRRSSLNAEGIPAQATSAGRLVGAWCSSAITMRIASCNARAGNAPFCDPGAWFRMAAVEQLGKALADRDGMDTALPSGT
jgi:hypothetical protein